MSRKSRLRKEGRLIGAASEAVGKASTRDALAKLSGSKGDRRRAKAAVRKARRKIKRAQKFQKSQDRRYR